jgi:hypothetical protein
MALTPVWLKGFEGGVLKGGGLLSPSEKTFGDTGLTIVAYGHAIKVECGARDKSGKFDVRLLIDDEMVYESQVTDDE